MSDPGDIKAWSGTVYHLAKMLEQQGFPVEYMANMLRDSRLWMKAMERSRAWVMGRKPAPVDRRAHTAQRFAQLIEKRLRQSDASVVYSPSSIPLALLRTDRLKVFQTDATFAGIIHQYPELAEYPKEFMDEGHLLEKQALHNCDLAIYSSQWAARSAINDYGADPAKVHVIPFGSNLGLELDREEINRIVGLRARNRITLLFMGVHWQRKGGDIALDTVKELNARGIDVQLNIMGCEPPYRDLPAYVHVLPFLDKRKPDDRKRMIDTIQKSHFLILPSQADCTPIVVNECNSQGVPCLTSDVGGLPEMIREGLSGHFFSTTAPATAYADCVEQYMKDRSAYEQLAHGAYQEYQEWLGWGPSGTQVRKAILSLLGSREAIAQDGMQRRS
ncbi:MAG: glycosyltransferase family 4 protein [Bacteroidota bacterium]|nr:glycosyltransferase family 4 protein [Bacteroidota bacterium]